MTQSTLRPIGFVPPNVVLALLWPPDEVAVRVLNTIASDADRLARFLDRSGLRPDTIREAARSDGFLPGVLDYVTSDEPTLLDVAQALGVPPSIIARAHAAMTLRAVEP